MWQKAARLDSQCPDWVQTLQAQKSPFAESSMVSWVDAATALTHRIGVMVLSGTIITAYNLHRAPSALRKAKASAVPSIPCSRQMLRCPYPHTAKEQLFLEAEKHFQMEEISKKESKSSYSERLWCLHICCTTHTHTLSLTFPRTLMGLGNQIPFRSIADTYCNCSATPTTPDKM